MQAQIVTTSKLEDNKYMSKNIYHMYLLKKDLGKKCFEINKIEDTEIIEKIINL